MNEFKEVARWISQNYPSASKIVEVGVGKRTQALSELAERLPECELIATDVSEVSVPEGVNFKKDDIMEPQELLYRGADLIFSLRTPQDLYPYLYKIAEKMESDLLLKPISSEEAPTKGELINYSGVFFYLVRSSPK